MCSGLKRKLKSPRPMSMAVEARKLEAMIQLRRVCTGQDVPLLRHDGFHPDAAEVSG